MSTLEASDSSNVKDGENLAEVKPKKNNCLMITLIVISCVVVVGLALGLSLGLTIGKKDKKPANDDKRPIVVVAAMKSEFEYLLANLTDVNETHEADYTFYAGKINDYSVVIAHCRVNEINAGIATLLAIQKFNPRAIINEGTAGGYGYSIHRNDIVIGERVLNAASFKTKGRKKGEGSNSLEWDMISFFDGDADRLYYINSTQHLIDLAKKVEYNGNVTVGTVGSSDNWNSEVDRILDFNDRYGVLCEEMEAYSVYTVANMYKVPVIAVKVISNNDMLGESYDTGSAVNSQKFTYDLILKIINE